MQQTPNLQLLPKFTTSILKWFLVYSGIPQMQGTSSWLLVLKPLLLRLHGGISFSLLCSHSSWGSALIGPAYTCRSSSGISLSPGQEGVKGAAGYGALSHSGQWEGGVWNAGGTCGSRGWHDVATAWGTPCVLPGKLSLGHRILAVAVCTDSWEGSCG